MSAKWPVLNAIVTVSSRSNRSVPTTTRLVTARRVFRSIMIPLLLLAMMLPGAGSYAVDQVHAAQQVSTSMLRVTGQPDRKNNRPLKANQVFSGSLYIFLTTNVSPKRVRFYLDPSDAALEEPTVGGTPRTVDSSAPYDFAGTNTNGKPLAFDTRTLANGPHTVTAAIDLPDGGVEVISEQFVVHNGGRALRFLQNRLKLKVPKGQRSGVALPILASTQGTVDYTVRSSASWIKIEAPFLTKTNGKRKAPEILTVSADTAGLAPGNYSATITATADEYATASTTVDMTVTAAGTCSPLACEEILVQVPYVLNFSQDHGKILDRNGVGTGFTYIDKPTFGTGYIPQNLTVNTPDPGTLKIATTGGIMSTNVNSQDNALAVGIDAPSQISLLNTTLLNPSVGTGNFEQAGLWFGNNEDNYVKFGPQSNSIGTKIHFSIEINGLQTYGIASPVLDLANARVDLTLRANPNDRTIKATYRINGGTPVVLAQKVVPSEFFSFDAAGIDPTIGTRSFGGIYATHRKGSQQVNYSFDSFSLTSEGTAAPVDSTGVTFDRSSFSLSNPTAMVWGPDNRLYVTELLGKIHAVTLNADKKVVSDQVITTLGTRLTLGITVDPDSTPDNVILWVSHSSPSLNNGELNSSTVTRLSGSGFTTRQDVITGLPRAIANHAINNIEFGPDGRLYMMMGGNTGAGAPNTANSEFGTRAEQPLSAAAVVADVKAAGFDGTCAAPENTFAPSPCSVQPYSTGLRNAYDLAWHSNGTLYAPDNGLGVTGTYPSTATPPCTGFGDPALYTNGGNNPGEQPDFLKHLQPNKYYGHPNPYRNECVFYNGSYQGVAPLSNYVAPMFDLGVNRSADGIIEYTADTFNGALKGELLITNYSLGDNITRLKLSADGTTVVAARTLMSGFNDPLPITQGPDGTIYVGEFGGSLITALKPANSGSWTTRQVFPFGILDPSGTALNGKFYVVGGKTATAHLQTMYIYNPTSNTWSQGPDLPGPGVENPAVTALDGKLYVISGSTAAFSGAVTNAAVYDPATNDWTPLAPIPTGRGGATAQAINGKIYVAGGMGGDGASVATVDVYDPATNTWSAAAPMSIRRDNPGSATFNGKLYVFGGRTRNADATTPAPTLNTVEMYDPATNTWSARASMPTGRRTMVVGLLNGRAQVMGGEIMANGGSFPQNEEYDPASNSWRSLTPMLTPRHGATAATINGVVYVAGGGPKGGTFFSNTNEAFAFDTTDTTAPTVAGTSPADGATNVAVGSAVAATFSEAMDPATLTASTFTLVKQGTTSPIAASVSYDAATTRATLDPNADLSPSTTYVATITTGAKDTAGNALATAESWSFTTAGTVDTTAPTVANTSPADGATNVAVGSAVAATFSEAMDPATLTASTFTLVKQGTTSPIAASVSYDAATTRATLDPNADLSPSTTYVATITTGAKDVAGNALATAKSWTFTTAAASSTSPYALWVSSAADRSSPTLLANRTVSGNIYVFTLPESGVRQVRFYLDDPTMAARPRSTEGTAPYDFAGGSVVTALPFKTTTLTNGTHTITAAVDKTGGGVDVIHATFTVNN